MKRVVKAHEERRTEILDGAWELFTTRGFEGATVAAIIDKVGIAKGTFYHYFESKEDVLDALADRFAAATLPELTAVTADETLAAGPKLNRFMEVARKSRVRRMDSVLATSRILYRDENLIIRHKLAERLKSLVLPLLQSILEQGMREGCFRIVDASEGAEFFWALSNSTADMQMKTLLGAEPVEDKVATLVRRVDFACESLERMLGADAGLLHRPSPEIFGQFVRAVSEAT